MELLLVSMVVIVLALIPDFSFFQGVGFFFALTILCLTYLQTRYTDTLPRSSEEFTVQLIS